MFSIAQKLNNIKTRINNSSNVSRDFSDSFCGNVSHKVDNQDQVKSSLMNYLDMISKNSIDFKIDNNEIEWHGLALGGGSCFEFEQSLKIQNGRVTWYNYRCSPDKMHEIEIVYFFEE